MSEQQTKSTPQKTAENRRKSQPEKNQAAKNTAAQKNKQTTSQRKQTTQKNVKNQKSQKKEGNSSDQRTYLTENRKGHSKATSRKSGSPLKIIPLGGLDEIGKNLTVYEYGNDLILVDCGMTFPDAEMPGVDIVIPDYTYLLNNKDKIRGIVLTHGHEDHIGGLPYFLKQINVPLYGTRLTLGLVEGKLKEHGLFGAVKMHVVRPGDTFQLGCFSIECIHVNHSIPDALAFAITTPVGVIVQTGDFKIDSTPIDGEIIDLARFAELGKQGVLALLADSTNAERPGYTMSERIVGDSFSHIFKDAGKKRIIVATFSSNIHRVQQIINEAVNCGRKVAVSGRSMVNVVNIGQELGYLNVPDGVLIDIDMVRRYSDDQLVIVTTGSQGEPMSALRRMAFGDHRKVNVGPNDLIIISATPIPGNEKMVGAVVNELLKLNCDVVYEKMYDVHVSGHACQEELKMMISLVQPQFFIPVHGEQKHLRKHASLAKSVGVPEQNIMITTIGNVIEFTEDTMKLGASVPAGRVLVDGLGVGDVGSIVLRDRKHLAEDGLIIVAMTIDGKNGEIVAGPDLVSRGFVYVRESEELMDEARAVVVRALEECHREGIREWSAIKTRVRDALSSFIYERTRRSPMILPVIMQI